MKVLAGLGLSIVWLLSACGGTPHVVTQKVYTDPNREVGLQTVSERSRGEGFSHPAFLKNTDIANVLKGLYVERRSSISLPLVGGGESERYPVFNQNEIAFFAPLLAQGFGLAQPNEVVTFYERGEISHLHEVRTSGGLFHSGRRAVRDPQQSCGPDRDLAGRRRIPFTRQTPASQATRAATRTTVV